jgi:hypothetical protein
MSKRGITILALGALITSVCLGAFTVWLGATRNASVAGISDYGVSDPVWSLSQIAFVAMGAVVITRRRRNLIGWMFLIGGFTSVAGTFAYEYAFHALHSAPGSLPLGPEMASLYFLLLTPVVAWFALGLLLFPDGRLPSSRWRPVVWVVAAGIITTGVASIVLWPHRTDLLKENFDAPGAAGVLFNAPYVLLIPGVVAAFASLVARFRRADQVERLQLKWFVFAAIVSIVGTFVGPFTQEVPSSESELLASAGSLLMPVAIGIAITRYRLYEIDRVINRTLVYGALSALLAAAYLGIVVALQNLIPGADDSDLTIAGSTLAVAALFRPLRARIQGFIDRRFYRSKYDTQRTLESFSTRLREDVDLHHLSADLLGVVRDTMQPAHASLWLKEKSA